MSTLPDDAHDVFHLRMEIKAVCRTALPIATSVDQNDAVLVGQLLLLPEGLFGRIESLIPVGRTDATGGPRATVDYARPS